MPISTVEYEARALDEFHFWLAYAGWKPWHAVGMVANSDAENGFEPPHDNVDPLPGVLAELEGDSKAALQALLETKNAFDAAVAVALHYKHVTAGEAKARGDLAVKWAEKFKVG